MSADWTAVGALGVAVIALAATLWQGWITRHHSRLSVRPVLDYHDVRDSPQNLGLNLVNHGLGPALIENVQICVDGRKFKQQDSHYKAFVAEQLKRHGFAGSFQALTEGAPIPVGETLELFRLQVPPDSDERLLAATRFLSRIELTVRYASMYGEVQVLKRTRDSDA